jgi:hypothetical protein
LPGARIGDALGIVGAWPTLGKPVNRRHSAGMRRDLQKKFAEWDPKHCLWAASRLTAMGRGATTQKTTIREQHHLRCFRRS